MDLLHSLINLAAVYILAAILPGPNTLVVSHLSASVSRRAGLTASFGVATGTIAWVTLSLCGVGVLLLEAGTLYRVLRLVAAVYLIYAGIRIFLSGPVAADDETGKPKITRSPYMTGLLTNLSNPKGAAFWTSVFIVLVPAHAPLWFYAAVIVVITIEAFGWYASLALLLSSGPAKKQYQRFTRWIDRVTGVVMVALGIKLADEVRREVFTRV
ncbi:LysE family translocator [Flaviflagellibacter deserti]|uniref:LysE family translocator n=1 Tax=Flaviflagellibacter deserti TaxID=2267266 RepID=A0ABV9Z3R8_9HYPH